MSLLDEIAKAAAARKVDDVAKATAAADRRKAVEVGQGTALNTWAYKVRPAIRKAVSDINRHLGQGTGYALTDPIDSKSTMTFNGALPVGEEPFIVKNTLYLGNKLGCHLRFALEIVPAPDFAVIVMSCEPDHVDERRLPIGQGFDASEVERWLQEVVSASLKSAA